MENIKPKSRIRIYLPLIIVISLLAYLTAGCATIFSGTEQDLKVQPAGAQLEVYSWDGKLFASPKTGSDSTVTVHRPKGQSYLIRVQKEGFCPRYWLTSPKTNPVTYGNFIIGGLLGIIIDGATGAGNAYAPSEFQLNIPETQQCGS